MIVLINLLVANGNALINFVVVVSGLVWIGLVAIKGSALTNDIVINIITQHDLNMFCPVRKKIESAYAFARFLIALSCNPL